MKAATIKYVKGDATNPHGQGPKIIVHICNDIGAWGKGFVLAISKRWKNPEGEYKKWQRSNKPIPFKLGNVQFVLVEPSLWIANLIGQRDIRSRNGIPPIRYRAVRKGLNKVAEFAKKHKAMVHMPRIGCGLAGGKWEEIEKIIEETLVLKSINVTVYDL